MANMDFQKGDYIISKKTLATHYKTNDSISKKKEWLCADVPSIIIIEPNEDNIIINQFTSSPDRNYIVRKEDFKFFKKCRKEGEYICDLKWYPEKKLKISEFEERKRVLEFTSNVKNLVKSLPKEDMISKILSDKFGQLNTPQGAPCDTIQTILNYNIEEIRNHPTKRTNNMIFNRCSRWTPPIPDSYSYEEYQNSINFTRPIGTRPKDFCLPSELIDTMKEMIRQIICFKNINPETKEKVLKIINKNDSECSEIHKCKWSGKEVDVLDYSSTYASKDNFIEICHRDPHDRFLARNMYWGFGESNRQQGGYSEKERVKQTAQLCKYNPEMMELLRNELNLV